MEEKNEETIIISRKEYEHIKKELLAFSDYQRLSSLLIWIGIAMAHSLETETGTVNNEYLDSMDKDGDGICDYCEGDMPVEECAEMHEEFPWMDKMHESMHSEDNEDFHKEIEIKNVSMSGDYINNYNAIMKKGRLYYLAMNTQNISPVNTVLN